MMPLARTMRAGGLTAVAMRPTTTTARVFGSTVRFATTKASQPRQISRRVVQLSSLVVGGTIVAGAGVVSCEEGGFFSNFFPKKKEEQEVFGNSKSQDSSSGEEKSYNIEDFVDRESLPIISLEEVRKHKSGEAIWVTYEGLVFDITSFIENHPGGKELALTAGGLDLGHFFDAYTVHQQSDKAFIYLSGLVIGKLTPEEAVQARKETTPEAHIESRLNILGNARWRLLGLVLMLPFWLGIRFTLRIVGFVVPPLGHYLASLLPVSIPGLAGAAPIVPTTDKPVRVAVIGGGIAGSGCAYALSEDGYEVTVYEARETISGNAKTFDWDIDGRTVKTCVAVTAWVPTLYNNYTALLEKLNVETVPMPLSWFLYSKVPGSEGYLWPADPEVSPGSLRERFKDDFDRYEKALGFIRGVTRFFTFEWFNYQCSMYRIQVGFAMFNPLNLYPLHHVCRWFGVSQEWWDVVFTPYYTASFLTDKLDNMTAVVGPLIEAQIPLLPTDASATDNTITTCVTWKDAGKGIRDTFAKLTDKCTVHTSTRVLDVSVLEDGRKQVVTEHGAQEVFDKVVFACQCTAIGNMHKAHNWVEDALLAVPEYADDHHPGTGHMHGVMHNDSGIVTPEWREEVVRRGSNYVEITEKDDGSINIENTYNFGVQTPGVDWFSSIPAHERPPLLISHSLGAGKEIKEDLIRGRGNHARAHPLLSGWNMITMLSLRLIQGRQGMYYCANWTTPGNCHDLSLVSGLVCAHAIGAKYPFEDNSVAKSDFQTLRFIMGL